MENSNAEQRQLKAGDVIIAVDNQPSKGSQQYIVKGNRYEVKAGQRGDLYILDEDGDVYVLGQDDFAHGHFFVEGVQQAPPTQGQAPNEAEVEEAVKNLAKGLAELPLGTLVKAVKLLFKGDF